MNQLKLVAILVIALIINGTTFTSAETKEVQTTNTVEVVNTQPAKEEVDQIIVEEETIYPKSYVQKGFEDVKKEFDKMIENYKTENLAGVLNLISNKDDVVFISSGTDILIGKDEITKAFTKDFEVTKKIDITIPWVYITGKGDSAVLTAIIDAEINLEKGSTIVNARQSLTFEKQKDGWKIVNSHLSYPAQRAVDSETVKVKTEEPAKK